MKPYALQRVPKEELWLFTDIKKAVEDLPEIDLEQNKGRGPVLVSCHMLARAVARHFPAACRDGYFGKKMWGHSWCVTPYGNIIDPYPWASPGGPVLLMTTFASPWSHVYRESELPFVHDAEFLINAERVTVAMGKVVARMRRLK